MAETGLKSNAVGLFGGTMLGISSVAPAYALTATLGILAASVGAKTLAVIIAGFLPMFFAAYAYREFNKISPTPAPRSPGPPRHSVPTSAGGADGQRCSPRASCRAI